MFDFEEFGKRSIYRRHLDTGLVSVVYWRYLSCVVFARIVCRGSLFKWGKGENSTNGWRARIEDRGSHVTDFFDYFAKFSEALSRRSSCPTNRGLRSADGNGQYISVVLVSGMANESG